MCIDSTSPIYAKAHFTHTSSPGPHDNPLLLWGWKDPRSEEGCRRWKLMVRNICDDHTVLLAFCILLCCVPLRCPLGCWGQFPPLSGGSQDVNQTCRLQSPGLLCCWWMYQWIQSFWRPIWQNLKQYTHSFVTLKLHIYKFTQYLYWGQIYEELCTKMLISTF